MCFSPPKQAVALSEPNFWTHSLQIHCNGLGPKTMTLQFKKETMHKLVSNQTLMYISKLIHNVNHSESKIRYNYRLFSMIVDYEIGF